MKTSQSALRRAIKIMALAISVFPFFVLASIYDPNPPGTKNNPYYFEEYKDPIEEQKDELKNKYGISNFYSCWYACTYETANPSNAVYCLAETRNCLEFKNAKKQAQEFQCQAGYVKNNNSCITVDQHCQLNYGNFSKSNGILNGVNQCVCMNGYVWNSSKTQCLELQCQAGYVKYNNSCISNDEQCRLSYGNFLKSDGIINGLNKCVCISGYSWDGSKCVPILNANPSSTSGFVPTPDSKILQKQSVPASTKAEDDKNSENNLSASSTDPVLTIEREVAAATAGNHDKQTAPTGFFSKIGMAIDSIFKKAASLTSSIICALPFLCK